MKLHPFSALRPRDNATAARMACPPYDVMSTAEARALSAGEPLFFLRVIRPEVDLPDRADGSSPEAYAHAKDVLDGFLSGGALVREGAPSLYLYRQAMGTHVQTAVVGCFETDAYDAGAIVRHEKTRKDKEDDRTEHILRTGAQTGQVFLCHPDEPAVDAIVHEETKVPPMFDFSTADGIRHTVWRVVRTDELVRAYDAVPKVYIADGHHRSAAASRAAKVLRGEDPANIEAGRFMACVFPASQLSILPYNRCVRDLNGMTEGSFLNAVQTRGFRAERVETPDGLAPRSCAMRVGDAWWRLSWTLSAAQAANPVARLDVTRLQEDLLAPVLGIGDPRTDPRIFFVGGIRGTAELEKAVREGTAAVAFAMHPTTVSDMMAIADAGATMPPKSTWFEPKLRSGLLLHEVHA